MDSLKFWLDDTDKLFLPDAGMSGVHFHSDRDAEGSPLAEKLFALKNVTGVFIAPGFVSVNKQPGADWPDLQPSIEALLSSHAQSDEQSVSAEHLAATEEEVDEDEVSAMIREIIDTRIRPSIQDDGGDLIYLGFEDGTVRLRLAGSCVGCASSTETLYNGVEQMLMYYVPEVERIEQVVDEMQQLGQDTFHKLEEELAAKRA